MKTNLLKLFFVGLCSLTVMLCSSCESDNPVSKVPTFSGYSLNVNRSYLIPGEQITVTAKQATKGAYISTAKYVWTVIAGDSTFTSSSQIVYDQQNADPQFTFKVPAVENPVYATIALRATYINSCSQYKDPGRPATNSGFTCSYSLSTWENTVSMSQAFAIIPN